MKKEKKQTTSVKNSTKNTSMPERKRRSTKVSNLDVEETMDEMDTFETSSVQPTSRSSSPFSRIAVVLVLIVALLGYGAYKYQYLLTPAVVNGEPIYIWTYLGKLHTQFGRDQLNSMATELMITQAVTSSKVDVPSSQIEDELSSIEKEASSSGGIRAVLEAQRMSMDEFKNRIRLQLAVKKILAEKIVVTDQEVEDAYKKNKDFYKGMSDADAKAAVRRQLEDQKFQTEVSTWLADVKSKAKIEVKFPGI